MATVYYEQDGITIYHGDCREVLPTVPPVDLVLTDPPYGIKAKSHGQWYTRFDGWNVAGDQDQDVGLFAIDFAERSAWPVIAFASPMLPWAGKWRQHLVWDKGKATGIGGDRETCWLFNWELIQVRGLGELAGTRDSSVLSFPINGQSYKYHPCEKPVSLIQYLLSKTTAQTILDPFMGSGTTLVASKQLGRRAIGIEVDERYCEIAATRLQQSVMPLDIPTVTVTQEAFA